MSNLTVSQITGNPTVSGNFSVNGNTTISNVLSVPGTLTANVLTVSGALTASAIVPSSSFLRNRLINGDMEIAQRGSSGTSGFVLDRWFGVNTSAQSQSSDAPPGFINSLEFTSSSATFPFVLQRIERFNSYDLAGQTVTVSFWAKNVSGSSNIYAEIYRANSNDNFSNLTLEGILNISASPSSSWTYYTASIALSASATTGIELRIIRNNLSATSTRITGVQIEVGSVATPFERRHFGQELMLCQRYYSKTYSYGVAPGNVSDIGRITVDVNGRLSTTNRYTITYPYMRASPTITVYNPGTGGSGTVRGDNSTNYSAGIYVAGDTAALIDFVPVSPTTAVFFHFTASAEF